MIERTIFTELVTHLSAKEITLLVGARQVGKTTLMEALQRQLKEQGKRTLFLNLDYETDAAHFSSQEALLNKLRLEIGFEPGYVFIDEIQRKGDAGLFLKGIYDRQTPYKFIISGSGSLELKERIHESLAGRKRIFELLPVSLSEFIHFKTEYRYKSNWREYLASHPEQRRGLLADYLSFGGYPRVVVEEREAEKQRIMDEIFKSYIDKDISALLHLERRDAFLRMVQLAASQLGGLVTLSDWAATCGLSAATLRTYLWYAERTFILRMVLPYFTNLNKEIVKSPVVYFYDLGMRNFSLGMFGRVVHPQELSFLFQNMVMNMLIELIRWQGWSIHFWRTTDRAEVDFVLDLKHSVLPIEVKYADIKKPQLGRSLASFIRKYNPPEAWVINLSCNAEMRVNETLVRFLPFYELGSGEVLEEVRRSRLLRDEKGEEGITNEELRMKEVRR